MAEDEDEDRLVVVATGVAEDVTPEVAVDNEAALVNIARSQGFGGETIFRVGVG